MVIVTTTRTTEHLQPIAKHNYSWNNHNHQFQIDKYMYEVASPVSDRRQQVFCPQQKFQVFQLKNFKKYIMN